jgi:hypothetical protein
LLPVGPAVGTDLLLQFVGAAAKALDHAVRLRVPWRRQSLMKTCLPLGFLSLVAKRALLCKSVPTSERLTVWYSARMKPAVQKYRTTIWEAYNEALKSRGSLLIWLGPAMWLGMAGQVASAGLVRSAIESLSH